MKNKLHQNDNCVIIQNLLCFRSSGCILWGLEVLWCVLAAVRCVLAQRNSVRDWSRGPQRFANCLFFLHNDAHCPLFLSSDTHRMTAVVSSLRLLNSPKAPWKCRIYPACSNVATNATYANTSTDPPFQGPHFLQKKGDNTWDVWLLNVSELQWPKLTPSALLANPTAVQQLCAPVWEDICQETERFCFFFDGVCNRVWKTEKQLPQFTLHLRPHSPCVSAEVCWLEENK